MKEKKALSPDIIKEIKNLARSLLVCAVIMQLVFLLLGRYDYTVFLGTLLGYSVAVGNFALLGYTLESALGDAEDVVKKRMSASYNWRMLLQTLVMALSMILPFIHWVPVVILLLLPSPIIKVRMGFQKYKGDEL